MKRKIVTIDEEKCNGCGKCIPGCQEGALQIIDGKARLVSDLFCDGLGACIGTCPQNAIFVEEREAEPYSEKKVMEQNIIPKGENTIMAHLKHLKEHGESNLLEEGFEALRAQGLRVPDESELVEQKGCPMSAMFEGPKPASKATMKTKESDSKNAETLRNWPIQLKLLNPQAPYLKEADLLLSADCVAFASPTFHHDILPGKVAIILCPKLDQSADQYIEKLAQILSSQNINSITIARMEVPCCGGTEIILERAMEQAGLEVDVRTIIVGINGEIQPDK